MQKDREKIRMYNTIYVLAIVLIGFLCLLANVIYNNGAADNEFQTTESPQTKTSKPVLMTIYVTGEVASPGLYEVEPGIRAGKAIEIAGGPTEDADMESVNLAKILDDGDQVKVPAVKKTTVKTTSKTTVKTTKTADKTVEETTETPETEEPADAPISINCADVSKYMELSGMTEEIAANIVEFIELYGGFQSIEELQFVEGMTPALYKSLPHSWLFDF